MTHIHTQEQGLAALAALGYTKDDHVISVLVSAEQISVRRIEHTAGGWVVVEDRTILRPDKDLIHQHGPDADVGPLETSPAAGQGG